MKCSGEGMKSIAHPFGFLTRNADGFVWSTAGTPAFEVYSALSIANYGIAATEGPPGHYSFDNPAPTIACSFVLVFGAGVNLAVLDLDNKFWVDSSGPQPASLAAGSITDATFTVPADGTGQATGALSMLFWLYQRFYGKVVNDKVAKTVTTYQADGATVRTTQSAVSVAGVTDTVGRAT